MRTCGLTSRYIIWQGRQEQQVYYLAEEAGTTGILSGIGERQELLIIIPHTRGVQPGVVSTVRIIAWVKGLAM